MALPYRAHPLYHLRKALIVTDIIGIILSVLLIGPYGPSGDGSIPFWLAISAPVAAADLVFYATKKLADPDNNPPWPRKLWVIGDILLAIILQIVFWAAIASLSWRYSYGGDAIFGAYAALACFIASYVPIESGGGDASPKLTVWAVYYMLTAFGSSSRLTTRADGSLVSRKSHVRGAGTAKSLISKEMCHELHLRCQHMSRAQ